MTRRRGSPVPIPNTEVKLYCDENTWWETAREDSLLPVLYKSRCPKGSGFFLRLLAINPMFVQKGFLGVSSYTVVTFFRNSRISHPKYLKKAKKQRLLVAKISDVYSKMFPRSIIIHRRHLKYSKKLSRQEECNSELTIYKKSYNGSTFL